VRHCIGLVLALALLGAGCGGERPARGDVVLVIVDTARADHFSAYGYLRETTPELDRLAAEGERYDNAWAQSPWTLPAVATILTGQPPHVHGAGRTPAGMRPVRADLPTLAERMATAGYRTAAFINVLWCAPASGLDRGFENYDFRTSDESNVGTRNAWMTTDHALNWMRAWDDDPLFMVVHYFDPHLTYDPPAPFDTLFEEQGRPRVPRGFGSAAQVFRIRNGEIRLGPAERRSLIARYDGELRYMDEQFGRLRRGLEEAGRWDDALIIVLGDHGEEFWDHGGFEHGHSHHRELMRVPLVVKRPGGARGAVFNGRVRQIDVAPTVLGFAGLSVPAGLPGRVLGPEGSRFAVGEGSLWAGDLVSARSDAGTLILDRGSGELTYFASGDTFEHDGRRGEESADPELLRLLRALPAAPVSPAEERELAEEQLEQLRSLGYIQ
jgi:arylsulfatase A-like enzyme